MRSAGSPGHRGNVISHNQRALLIKDNYSKCREAGIFDFSGFFSLLGWRGFLFKTWYFILVEDDAVRVYPTFAFSRD